MPTFDPANSALLTDLYQLTMLQAYREQDMAEAAVFELFMRKLPPCRNFLVAAGLEQALVFLEELHFTNEELDWLKHSGRFSQEFVDYLATLRFTGDVHALPEGTLFFPDEPLLRITAPLPQAQLVESRLINILHFQTLIASKAVRCVLAAPDKLLVDFGMRRAHGAEAALMAARASYLAGMAGTATVLAEPLFGIPLFGTMAHSFIQAHRSEIAAFENFTRSRPVNTTLLIDTYDTEAAAHKVVALARKLQSENIRIGGVRIDSGDLGEHARKVRQIFDAGGYPDIKIFASSSLDEYQLQIFRQQQAPIDGYGIGTSLDTSADRPYLDCAYKLEEYAGLARRKRSEGKATWPGRKQVYRYFTKDGRFDHDVLTLEYDVQAGLPLVQHVMQDGRRIQAAEPLSVSRTRALDSISKLPKDLQVLEKASPYPVSISEPLRKLAAEVDAMTLPEPASRILCKARSSSPG